MRIKRRARFSRLGQQCIGSEQRGRLFDGAVGGQRAALQCIGYRSGNATGHSTLSRYYIAFPICVNHLQASTVRLHVRPLRNHAATGSITPARHLPARSQHTGGTNNFIEVGSTGEAFQVCMGVRVYYGKVFWEKGWE